MSTARSTTQTSDASRRKSSQIGQGDFSVSEPHVVQNWIFSRASTITSASCFTMAASVWTRCNAMRSAERGPTPGSLLNAEVNATMDSGSAATGKITPFPANLNLP
jgi:hypothetical protein